MNPTNESEKILREVQRIIDTYSNSKDPEVSDIVRELQKIQNGPEPIEQLTKTAKILWLLNKLREWIDRMPPPSC